MMKRSTKESVQDLLASKELYVSVSKSPSVTKLIWRIDPFTSGAENSDLKRKGPEAKYLQILSACLTAVVLWGIYWQVHNHLIPQLRHLTFSVSAHHDSFSQVAQIRSSNLNALQGDAAVADLLSSVGVRSAAATKHLLEVNEEQIPADVQQKAQSGESSWSRSLGPMLHRKLLSDFIHVSTN
ncbi:unnamed protein product [Calypogeia fissa]